MKMVVYVGITHVEKMTEKAVLVGIDAGKHIEYEWFPKKLAVPMGYITKDGQKKVDEIKVPYWLAEQKGLLAKTHNGYYVYDVHVEMENK